MTAKVRDVINGSMFSFLAVIREIHIYLPLLPEPDLFVKATAKRRPRKGTSLHGLKLYELSWLGTRNDHGTEIC